MTRRPCCSGRRARANRARAQSATGTSPPFVAAAESSHRRSRLYRPSVEPWLAAALFVPECEKRHDNKRYKNWETYLHLLESVSAGRSCLFLLFDAQRVRLHVWRKRKRHTRSTSEFYT